jgi:hypothetical protein
MTKARQHPKVGTIISAVAALATVLTLSACAPAAPHPGSTTHAHAGSGHGSGSVPKPKPTPLADPVSRIKPGCAGLASSADITTAIGVNAPVAATGLALGDQIVYTQDGALACNWSDNQAGDASQTSNHLSVWVVPDLTDAEWAIYSPSLADDAEAKTAALPGDAWEYCSADATQPGLCDVDARVGTTWVRAEVESQSKKFATDAATLAHFAPLLSSIINKVGAAGAVAEPRWSDPAAIPALTGCASIFTPAQMATATGATGFEDVVNGPDPQALSGWGVQVGTGEVGCDWFPGDQSAVVGAEILPSGGWAWSQVQQYASTQPGYAVVPNLGPDAVTYTDQGSGGTTVIEWDSGHNLITVTVQLTGTPAQQLAATMSLAMTLSGELPS